MIQTSLAVMIAAVYGLMIRMMFGFFGGTMEVLSLSLLLLAPLAIGYLTVALAQKVTSGWSAFFLPWLTSIVVLVITIAINLEGAICWFMIYPFFAFASGIGGYIAFVQRKNKQFKRKEDSDLLDENLDSDKFKQSLLLLLPLIAGVAEHDALQYMTRFDVERSVVIAAAPEQIWAQMVELTSISEHENRGMWAGFFDLPRHLNTTIDTIALGGRRRATFERGLYFDEQITGLEQPYRLELTLKQAPEQIPPHVLDEHLVIGGKYFKALKDTYVIEPQADGRSKLSLKSELEIRTPINWYAKIWTYWILGDLFEEQLGMIRDRSIIAK
jgi:hypothetical protein